MYERVLLTALLTAFSITSPSCLRSVHRWWSHLHGAARRGRSWTKMHMNRISSLEEWKESHISRLFSNHLESSHAFEAMTTNDDFLLLWTVNRYWLPLGKTYYRAWRGIFWHLLTFFDSSCETRTLSWWSANRHHLPQNPRTTKTKMKEDNFIKLYRIFNLPLSSPSLPIPDGKVVYRSYYVLFICKPETSNQPIFLQISKDCEYCELSTQGYNRIHITILRTCMNESFLLPFSLHFPSLPLLA